MLAIYLLGCAGTSMLVGSGLPLGWLFATMFAMGLFASIYHPAGLAFISQQTSFTDRPRALGIHGVFGSAGIALAPFLAGLVLTVTSRWNTYYLVLWVPAVILGLYFIRLSWTNQGSEMRANPAVVAQDQEDDRADWRSYFALVVLAMMMGFTYSAVLSFLPRYLDGVGIRLVGVPEAGMRNYLTGSILLIGCIGQYVSGRLARPAVLERQLSGVMFASAPCLLWMAYAHGWLRLWATGLFTLIHFMHQPIYNSLIAKYSPKHRRSLAYGFSFAAGMGLGSLGAIFAGNYHSDYVIYTSLAGLASVGVVGLGYVGLPLSVGFAERGFRTVGIDTNKQKVDCLNRGKNYIPHIEDARVARAVKKKKLQAMADYSCVSSLDVIYICVPTPFTANKEPDISFILSAVESITRGLRKDHLVILKSTTFPGTTEQYVLPILQKTGLKVGKDFYLAFSPERIDPGNKKWTTANTPVVVGGMTAKCTELSCLISGQIASKVIPVSSPRVAEMEKLLENIFRSVNIALVNELAQLCDRMGGVSMWEVIEAAATKPFGFMPFYPGPGIGGHCILVDPYYLQWFARQYDFQTNFIALAAETNESMPFYVKRMVLREISMLPVGFREARILILGIAFKKDVDDIRHSPALKLMELLIQDGARNIHYNDPYVPRVSIGGQEFRSVRLTKQELAKADCVLITTNHSAYDYNLIVRVAKRIIDTRNATRDVQFDREKIVVLGDGK